MGKEIELKYLVTDSNYRELATDSFHIRQTYLSSAPAPTVRVRTRGDRAFLTVKGLNHGAVRDEWEYEIPVSDAEQMAVSLTGGWSIDKTRHIVPFEGYVWEVDEFHGRHEGLVIAEVELLDETVRPPLPPFVGQEVTGDVRYYNSSLSHL